MDIVFIADYFADEIPGGGELNNDYLCDLLQEKGHSVYKIKSRLVSREIIEQNESSCFIVANFVELPRDSYEALKKCRYIIYEHDHKYAKSRNPGLYNDYVVPPNQLINLGFYRSAAAVFCQSGLHSRILHKNVYIDNIKNLSGNIWSNEILDFIENLIELEKKDQFSVMDSAIPHKNTSAAIKYCEERKENYELISGDYRSFLEKLAGNDKFVFLPLTPETLSRVVVEARMLGVEVHTNLRVGAASEPWFHLKGRELIKEMRSRQEHVITAIEEVFTDKAVCWNTPKKKFPKISLVTSLYSGDDFIEDFLNNLTSQTIFDNCELIIVDGNSPGNERTIIEQYMERFPNIIYERLEEDPGIYGCWNHAIRLSTGEFISNANLDDRRSLQQLEIFANILMQDGNVDLVYSECFLTNKPNETYSNNSSEGLVYSALPFTPENMIKCLPGCMPLWRKTMHDRCGYFNDKLKYAGDWELWLRAVRSGSEFKRVDGIHGLYYNNPYGLSTDETRHSQRFEEEKQIFFEFKHMFGDENLKRFQGYFSQ